MTVHRERLDTAELDPLRLLGVRWPGDETGAYGIRRFYWSAPDTGETVAGIGWVAHGLGAFGTVARRYGADGVGEPSSGLWTALATARRAIGTRVSLGARAVREGMPAFVMLPFDLRGHGSRAADDAVWRGMDAATVVVPAIAVTSGPDGSFVVLAGPRGSARRLRERARAVSEALAATPADTGVPRSLPSGDDRFSPGGQAPPSASEERWSLPGRSTESSPADRLAPADRAALRQRVTEAIDAIRAGVVDKVVLATSLTVTPARRPDAVAVLARLRARQPGTFHFLFQHDADRAFVGATPERLVAVRGTTVRTMALAGSARRDDDPEVDRALGEALLASAKDRAEHRWVVDAIRSALAPVAADVSAPDGPVLLRLATIQHLETPIAARLAHPVHLLDLAAMLHPTPALGGAPREPALALIRRLEGRSRGWYGGAVGVLRGAGEGDLAVAIRCLLLHGARATAFAGAGIVAGSDPDAEVAEIELKLGAALDVLREPDD